MNDNEALEKDMQEWNKYSQKNLSYCQFFTTNATEYTYVSYDSHNKQIHYTAFLIGAQCVLCEI